MARFFNTAGPCDPADHYMLDPLARLPDVHTLIDRKQYFVLHAPRQSGKTTSIKALADVLAREGRYAAVYVSAEQGQALQSDIGAAEDVLLSALRLSVKSLPESLRPPAWPDAAVGGRFRLALTTWAEVCPRPLVLFIDEIDALRDDALISVLRQIRAGYPDRPARFPWSIALVGLRDVRDYAIEGSELGRLGTASPFNIKVESLTMPIFSHGDLAELYAQHTEETGQSFDAAAIDRASLMTGGQPWLVNALARETTASRPTMSIVRQACSSNGRTRISTA